MTNTLSPTISIHKRMVHIRDSAFEISVVANGEHWAQSRINTATEEISRVLTLLSTTEKGNQINKINKYAGKKPVKVDQEIFNLISRAIKVSDLTRGAFHITSAKKHTHKLVIADKAKHPLKEPVIILDAKANTVFLQNKGTQINIDHIVKGYAMDRAKYVLRMEGVSSGVINAFDGLITWGLQPNDTPWTLEAINPDQQLKAFSGLNISNMAVSTSGSKNDSTSESLPRIKSVSVLSPSAELAASMAAPVMTMGVKLSLNMFNRLNQLVCVIVNNRKKVYTSKSISMITC